MTDMANNNQPQQATTRQDPWQAAMAQILMQQAMTGNNNFLWGTILSRLLKNGWESQKKRYDESVIENRVDPSVPVANNLYSNIHNWLGGMFGTRKPRPAEGNVPTYQSERDQLRQDLFDGRSLVKNAMNSNVTPQTNTWGNIPSMLETGKYYNPNDIPAWGNEDIDAEIRRQRLLGFR